MSVCVVVTALRAIETARSNPSAGVSVRRLGSQEAAAAESPAELLGRVLRDGRRGDKRGEAQDRGGNLSHGSGSFLAEHL